MHIWNRLRMVQNILKSVDATAANCGGTKEKHYFVSVTVQAAPHVVYLSSFLELMIGAELLHYSCNDGALS